MRPARRARLTQLEAEVLLRLHRTGTVAHQGPTPLGGNRVWTRTVGRLVRKGVIEHWPLESSLGAYRITERGALALEEHAPKLPRYWFKLTKAQLKALGEVCLASEQGTHWRCIHEYKPAAKLRELGLIVAAVPNARHSSYVPTEVGKQYWIENQSRVVSGK